MGITAGEKIRLKAIFTDSDGMNTDPTEPVNVTVKAPDGTLIVDEVEATRVSRGEYRYVFTATMEGYYEYKFQTADDAIEVGDFTAEEDVQ